MQDEAKVQRIFSAVEAGNVQETLRCLKEGISPDVIHENWDWPLVLSAVPYPEVLKLLIDWKVNIDVQEHNKWYSPLINAARLGQLDSLKLLLEEGADSHLLSFAGLPALFYSIERGHDEISENLLQQEIDINFLKKLRELFQEKNVPLGKFEQRFRNRMAELDG